MLLATAWLVCRSPSYIVYSLPVLTALFTSLFLCSCPATARHTPSTECRVRCPIVCPVCQSAAPSDAMLLATAWLDIYLQRRSPTLGAPVKAAAAWGGA